MLSQLISSKIDPFHHLYQYFFSTLLRLCQPSILQKAAVLHTDYTFLKYFLGSTLTHQTGHRVPQPTLPEQGKQKHRANATYANTTSASFPAAQAIPARRGSTCSSTTPCLVPSQVLTQP